MLVEIRPQFAATYTVLFDEMCSDLAQQSISDVLDADFVLMSRHSAIDVEP